MEKYPSKFSEASHGLVLETFEQDDFIFCGGCKITRIFDTKINSKMVSISGLGGSIYSFEIEEKNEKQFGHIIQLNGQSSKKFRVIPYNMPIRSKI